MTKIYYDITDLRALVELARTGSFSKAADRLSITPSALSRRIAKLESAIGGLVVERTTRSMVPTEVGKLLLTRAGTLLDALDDSVADAARVASGEKTHISIGCIATVAFAYLPSAIAQFKQRYPHTRVNVVDGEAPRMTSAVLQREVEFAVTAGSGENNELESERAATDTVILLCPEHHALGNRDFLRWKDLMGHSLLGFKSHVSIRQTIDRALEQANIELPWFYEVSSLASLIGAMRSGAFAAPVPRILAASLPELRSVRLVEPEVQREINLVRRNADLSEPARYLWDTIRHQIAGH